MSEALKVPRFKSEAEEAEWLYANREARDNEFVRAFKEGRTQGGTLEERIAARAKLADEEKKARELAARQKEQAKAQAEILATPE